MMRHFYFRLMLGIVFVACLIFSLITFNFPSVLLFLFIGASCLASAYSIWKKNKQG